MKFRRFLLSRLYRNAEPGDDGGGFDTAQSAAVDPNAATASDAGAVTPPADGDKPGTMLEAMFGQDRPGETAEAKAARLRDEQGRFARKPEEVPGQKPPGTEKPGEKPPADKAKPDLQMPEGLTPKAQERFQQLANTNKELSAKVAEFEPIVQSALGLQQTFQEHGVRREQFDQAMQVVGLMNRGDFRGALKALDEQRALIAMALGEPVPGADPLSNFPDLRAEVDNLQMTEARALEIARGRTVENSRRQVQERQHQEQQHQRAEQKAVNDGQLAVDRVCKDLMANDLDYARIEPMLLKEIQDGLLQGVPPTQWARIVQKTYGLIKQTAGSVRTSVQTTSVLRPTGSESPRQAPKSAFEAMWGKPAPSA